MAAELKTGRFLAGDLGAGIILSKFINGYTISAWYTATDTSDFTDSFNRNYHDKGVSITFPLRAFLGRDSRVVFPYRISAWTRDVGQDLDRRRNLFDFLGRNTPLLLDSDRGVSGKMAP